jgi:hypothetical protein
MVLKPVTADELREVAAELADRSRKLHNLADKLEEDRVIDVVYLHIDTISHWVLTKIDLFIRKATIDYGNQVNSRRRGRETSQEFYKRRYERSKAADNATPAVSDSPAKEGTKKPAVAVSKPAKRRRTLPDA